MSCKFGKVKVSTFNLIKNISHVGELIFEAMRFFWNFSNNFVKLKANETVCHRPNPLKLVKYEDPNFKMHIWRTEAFPLYNYKKQMKHQ